MFAISLSTLLISMAAPAMNHLVSNSRQTGAINDLVSSMHKARSAAITTNTRVTICTSKDGEDCDSSDWHEGWIVFSDRDADQNLDVGEEIISSSTKRTRMTIDSVGPSLPTKRPVSVEK